MDVGRKRGTEHRRAATVRERAAASGLGAEVRIFVEKEGQVREGKVLGFFESGFVLAGPFGLFEVVPWRSVNAVTQPTPNEVVVARTGPTGRQVAFDARHFDKWAGVTGAEVLEFVTAEVERFNAGLSVAAREESAQALEAVRDGKRVRLGVVEVDADGVHAPSGSVLWADLTRVARVGNVVELYTGTGRFQPALYLPELDVPDVDSFLEMAAEIHHVRAARQLPIETAQPPIPAPASDAGNAAATPVEHGTLHPPPGMAEPILATAEEKGLSGSPRWYIAHRRAIAVPERGVLALFGDGFAMSSGRKLAAYHWDEVSVTAGTPTSLASGGDEAVVFGKPDNRPLLSNRTFPDVGMHSGRLHQAHARYLLDRAVAAFTDGTELSIGAVTVTRDGIDYDDRSVPWTSVSGVHTDTDGAPKPQARLVVDLVDGAEPITIPFGDVANSDAFATLVGMMTHRES